MERLGVDKGEEREHENRRDVIKFELSVAPFAGTCASSSGRSRGTS